VRKKYNTFFSVGDIFINKSTGEIGLLTERYDIFDGAFEDIGHIWAWDLYWTGPPIVEGVVGREQSYTELGLMNLLREDVLILVIDGIEQDTEAIIKEFNSKVENDK
tara:strand:+ start:989 stop:1309 length:321 start_codon:yes stop_codon:yes gene_type:complete